MIVHQYGEIFEELTLVKKVLKALKLYAPKRWGYRVSSYSEDTPCLTYEQLAKMSPLFDKESGMFKVPKIIGGE